MDHAQGRAFHHHLARAIMHLNYLAGLLPFFEPSIEYDESPPPANLRLDHPTTRGLHTFVPRPTSEGPRAIKTTVIISGGPTTKKEAERGSPFLSPDSPTILMLTIRHRYQLYQTPDQAT